MHQIILTSNIGIGSIPAKAVLEAGQEDMCSSSFAATVKTAGYTHWELVEVDVSSGGCNPPSRSPDLSHHRDG